MQVINTNILSLNAQRNLGTSGNSLATSIQRLSSGLRINSAKDDAAGLAISERFTTQIRGLNQATRNANDGISLAQTAEGALSEVSNNLQRVRELAVQSRNATNSASDRLALDAEVQERIKEINRVASQTEFNGLKLLDGSFAGSVFQVGANFGQTIAISDIANATGTALGLAGGTLQQFTATGTTVQASFGAGDLTINGTAVTASADAKAIADAITALGQFGTTATATNTQSVNFADVIGSAGATAVAASTGPSGAFTTAVSNGAAAVASTTTVSGAFTNVTLGAADTFSIELTSGGNTFQLLSETNTIVTAADVDNALTVNAAALTSAGFTVAGTAAAGTLVISRSDAAAFDIVTTNDAGANGFAGANFATGTQSITNGTPAINDNDFQLSVGGNILFNEAGTNGATVTAAELDAAVGTFLANNTEFTATGSFAGGDIEFTRADGVNFQVTIDSNFTTTPGAFANAAFTTTTTNGTPSTLDTNPTFSLLLDGNALDLSSGFGSGDFTLTAADVAGIINGVAGFTATSNAGVLSITKDDGSNFTLAATGTDQVDGVEGLDVGAATTFRGSVDITSSLELTIGGNAPGSAGLTAGAATAGTVTYGAVNVSTAADADIVLRVVDSALSNVNGARANLGAIQNRFESVIANLQTTAENLSSARSRIRDTDFAAETAELTRNQILQQAGIAMLAQANQAPQSVLSLLR